jgi:phosphotriesterase-related protein
VEASGMSVAVNQIKAVPQVYTVTGPVPVDQLGVTLMHEHVLVLSVGLCAAYPQTFPRDQIVETCIEQLSALRRAGVKTLVDHSPYDLGRDPLLLAEVSAASGVQIICCTGVWVSPQRYFHLRDPAEAAELFIGDLTEGIPGTPTRAGIIKCALDKDGLTGPAERVLRACAIAHRRTGAPISTHTDASSRTGEAQQRIFADEGVDLSRVIIGHSGDTEDLDYLRGMLERGSYLGMDRFGAEDILPDARRVEVTARLCAEGYAGQLLLSHDANCWNDRTTMEDERRQRPHWHHRHVPERIVPSLLARGVTAEQIETMLVKNPRRIFARCTAYPAGRSAVGVTA